MGAVELFRPAPEPVPPRHVLTVGALLPSKGHDLVLRSVAATHTRRPVVVVTARQGREEEARLRALAGELGVALEVRVGVEDTVLRDLYRTALATVYLAREEPLGLVALEAQAAGCPVVVADDGGLPETVVDGETGFVVPRDPALVAERLERLEAPAIRRALAERAASHGAAATWERSAQTVEDHLRRVAARA
jgi:glycosyltransferase involved in cell wall biosynthesis